MDIKALLMPDAFLMPMYEVEIKAKAKPDTFKKIQGIGVKVKETHQKDIYYNSPWRDFSDTDEALRVREADGVLVLTYKGPKVDNSTKTRLEQKTQVCAGIFDILESLGFKKVHVVEKERHKYEFGKIKIAYDIVKGLGQYIELETLAKAEDIDKARDSLFSLFSELGFRKEDSITSSYLELLLEYPDPFKEGK